MLQSHLKNLTKKYRSKIEKAQNPTLGMKYKLQDIHIKLYMKCINKVTRTNIKYELDI